VTKIAKIYFGINGIGLGHAKRSGRIIDELRRRGHQIVCSTYSNTPAYNYLQRKCQCTIGVPELAWHQSGDGGISYEKTMLRIPWGVGVAVHHLVSEYYILKKVGPKIAISDIRASTIEASCRLGIPAFMIGLFFDLKKEVKSNAVRIPLRLLGGYLKHLAKKCEKVFFPDLPPPFTFYQRVLPEHPIPNIIFTGPILSEGIEFSIKENNILEVKEKAKERIGVSPDLDLILFIPSGVKKARTKFINDIIRLLPYLKRLKNEKIVVTMASPDRKLRIHRIGENIEIWTWIPRIDDYLIASDIIVGHVGMNKVFDAAAVGAFFIGIPTANQFEQIALAKRIQELKIGYYLRKIDKKLIELLIGLKNDNSWLKNVLSIANIIRRFKGVKTIIRVLEDYI